MTATLFQSCSKRNAFDRLIERQFNKCNNKNVCIIDLSKVIKSDWDTMYYFTNAYSLGEIDSILGFHLKEYIDVGDRMVLINKNRNVVYYQDWFPFPSDEVKDVVIFDTDKTYFVVEREKAIFSIRKENDFYFLKLIK
jgi:hypothetical protein